MWASRHSFPLFKWGIPIFLVDMLMVGVLLYKSAGADTDLYIMCFLIIYLSTLGRRIRDAIPLAIVACFLYALFLHHQHPEFHLTEPRLLLRFPFFLVLAMFSSYLSEQTEKNRRKVESMQEVQTLLKEELEKATVQLREKQTQLVQAEKLSAMGNMAGALAHEIRNPLSVIIAYVEDFLSSEVDPVIRKNMEVVAKSARRCQELIENLLRFARRPRESEKFRLKEVIEESLNLGRVGSKTTRIEFITDLRSDPEFFARRGEIQQIFLNLITNAVDAMPKGGDLTIRLENETNGERKWIKISFQDTGTGIPENIRSRIFEPFFTTKEPGKGTGLGLSIVQDIVRSYKGTLEIQSEPDHGTNVIVRFPA